MVEVKRMPIIIGLVIAIILGLVLGNLISWGDILGYLIATIYVGYSVGGDYTNGAIHGVLVGTVAAVSVIVISLLFLGVLIVGFEAVIIVLIIALIIGAIFGVLGGIIGVLVKGYIEK